MSPMRIGIGLLVASLFLSAEFLAFWYIGFPPMWIPIALFLAAGVVAAVLMHIRERKALRPYWERPCTGFHWRRRFPRASKTAIRDFLNVFVGAFGFPEKRRFSFSPGDKVMDVYRAIYPPGSALDGLELESFCMTLQKRYGTDFANSWREDMTLADVFEQTHRNS